MKTSLTPGSRRMSAAMAVASSYTPSMSDPLTWTSTGAGSPWFRIESTMPPDWKYVLRYGSCVWSAFRTRAMYS
jgi:hypothetical protein